MRFFTVGKATSTAFTALTGFPPSYTGVKGAEELADHILQLKEPAGPSKLLFLCGDNERTLPRDRLESQGIEVVQCTCYTTTSVSEAEFTAATDGLEEPRACVFFSPTGVAAVAKCAPNWPWDHIELLAIGTTTATALNQTFGRCDGVPDQFNLDGVIELVNRKFS